MNHVITKHVIRYILMIAILVNCITIFKFSAQTGEMSSSISKQVSNFIVNILSKKDFIAVEQKEQYIETTNAIIRKIAHFSIYALLGFLVTLCLETYPLKNGKTFLFAVLFSVIYAITDEVHQLFVPERSGNILDVGIDTTGAVLGTLLALVLVRIFLFISRKQKEKKATIIEEKSNRKKKKVLFIASTGGHLNEMMQLKKVFHHYDFHIMTEKTKIDNGLKQEFQEKMHYLIYGTKKNPIIYFFKFIANCFISLFWYFYTSPEIIITTGTHTAVPMCYIGKIFGSKIIFIETFANRTTATMAGKLVYPIADTFVVQWEEMHKVYPKAVCWGWIY